MAAHLSHKIRWNWMVDYLTPYSDRGIVFPVGECGRIHASKKKHQIQVEMRKYITGDMICTSEDCLVRGEKVFRKNDKKAKPFGVGERNDEKLKMFLENLYDVIQEFAATELKLPIRPVDYNTAEKLSYDDVLYCDRCNEFMNFLELGDKEKLFEYSETDLNNALHCAHTQAVGNSVSFLMSNVLKFYIYSNVLVHLDLRTEDQWPAFMRPGSSFRRNLLYHCDAPTFLPRSRKYLAQAMIDLDETRTLNKNLFRFVYFYVMVRMKFDSSYDIRSDFDRFYFLLEW